MPAGYSEQVRVLAESEAALTGLAKFVSRERAQLQDQEQYVNSLGAEADDLRQFLATERPRVQAILNAQAQKYQRDRWQERGVSFGIGILASLAAMVIWRRFSPSGNSSNTIDPDVP